MRRIFTTGVLIAVAAAWLGVGFSFFFVTARAQSQGGGPAKLNLFFLGKRQAQLESCGCRTKQQGGVQFEASLYDKQSAVPAVRVDAGDWTVLKVNALPEVGLRTRTMLRAMAILGMDAVNVGFSDMQLSAEFLKNLRQKYPGQVPNFVSANIFLKNKPDKPAFPTSRIVKRKLANGREVKIGITGVASFTNIELNILKNLPPPGGNQAEPAQAESANYVARRPKDCLGKVIAQLRPQVDLLVVLHAGNFADSVDLARAFPQIDYLITNGIKPVERGTRPQPTLEPSVQSFNAANVHIFCVQSYQGRAVGQATLELDAGNHLTLTAQPQSLAVNESLGAKQPLVALLTEFKKETRSLDAALPGMDVKMIYTGAMSCQQCHLDEYKDWQSTRHAHALQTLVDKGQEFNPDCLKCHTTGFRTANGFYTVTHGLSKQMFDVQCEVCHGPSGEHATIQQKIMAGAKNWMKPAEFAAMMKRDKEVIPPKQAPASVCLACHTPENDDHFVYDEKVKKINHPRAKKK